MNTQKMRSPIFPILACLLTVILSINVTLAHGQSTRYVKTIASGTADGSSWTNASTSLQAMINISAPGDMIFVEHGDYWFIHISLKEGVKIYGGFWGFETQLSQRNIVQPTILRGGNNFVNYNLQLTSATVIDGFTMFASAGPVISNNSSSPTISNCTFSGTGQAISNISSSPQIINCTFSGGGEAIRNSSGSPQISNCRFTGNQLAINNISSNPNISSCIFTNNNVIGAMLNSTNSNVVITNCSFDFNNNTTSSAGGAAIRTFDNSSAVVTGCHFFGNTAPGTGGGAIYTSVGCIVSITDCDFQSNSAYYGGAVWNDQATATITNCLFQTNSATTEAGAIFSSQSSVTITGSRFISNSAVLRGGAVTNIGNAPVFNYCIFSGNSSQDYAVMQNLGSNPVITNCLFSGNKAQLNGACIGNRSSSISVVTNCTFAGNNSGSADGVIVNDGGAAASINNSIIWNNVGAVYNYANAGASTVNSSIIQGGFAGTGNLNIDPGFISAPSYTTAPFTGGDYRVQSCSPAINAGSNALIPANITSDYTGLPRINGISVDMGAYEYTIQASAANIMYVNPNVSGGNNTGDSWNNAAPLLADVLQYVKKNEALWSPTNPLTILVAKGTYKPLYLPNNPCGGINPNNRDNAFLIPANVKIIGGFDPANGIDDITDIPITGPGGSILSGDIGAINNNSDNCYHVVIFSGPTGADSIYNFTISGGNANGSGTVTINGNAIDRSNGGGIHMYSSSPHIANCILSGNTSSNFGGALYGIISSFTLATSTFTSNTAIFGGAIFLNGGYTKLTGSSFLNNTAQFAGALYNHGGALPDVTGCLFSANSASVYGGAVYNNSTGAAPFSDCNFTNNTAVLGGAMFNNTSTLNILGSTFTTNTAERGGAMYNFSSASPLIDSSTFSGNRATIFGGAIFSEGAANPTIKKSLFKLNHSPFGGALFHQGNATVEGTIFSENSADSYGGAAYNNSFSPIYNSCVFHANFTINGGGGGGAVFNNNTNPVIANCTFSGNIADLGGTMYNYGASFSTVRNTVAWSNSSGIYYEPTAGGTTANCNIQGTVPAGSNISIDPMFVNEAMPAGPDGIWRTPDDGLRVKACSPVINTGSNALVTPGTLTDLGESPRVLLGSVDMGAYEAVSLADATVINIVNANTVASAWQLRNGQTFYAADCNRLIAVVTGNGNTDTSIHGNTTTKAWIESTQPAQFVRRHYEITPHDVAPAIASGTITLYFTQADFNTFNAINASKLPQHPSDAGGKANLRVEKRSDTSNDNTGLPGSYSGAITTINPDDADIIWNATASRWEVSFTVAGFSGFFVKTSSAVLPLRLISFTAKENNCTASIEWITTEESNVSHFEVQQSTDGSSYVTVKNIAATNTGNQTAYSTSTSVINDKTLYRLKMVDIDGRTTYSHTALITSSCSNRITIYPIPTKDKLYIRNAAIGSRYTVYDNVGKIVLHGSITNSTHEINTSGITVGIYFINVIAPSGNNEKLRFMKE